MWEEGKRGLKKVFKKSDEKRDSRSKYNFEGKYSKTIQGDTKLTVAPSYRRGISILVET